MCVCNTHCVCMNINILRQGKTQQLKSLSKYVYMNIDFMIIIRILS